MNIDYNMVFDVGILFLYYILYKFVKNMPHSHKLEAEQTKIRVDVETSFIELWDFVENTLTPLRARIGTRLKRHERAEKEKEEDLKKEESLKKGGLITPSQYKDYGIS